jgi:hypothetical protein
VSPFVRFVIVPHGMGEKQFPTHHEP